MSTSQFQYEQMLARLAANNGRELNAQSPGASAAPVERESKLHEQITDYCNSKLWVPIHSRMDQPTTTEKGVSDFIIVGEFPKLWFVEAKRSGNKATMEQLSFLARVRRLGWPQGVVHSMEEFGELIKSV